MNYLKTPWTSQPQQPVGIDWSNPITRGLVGWFTPFDKCANSGSAIRTAKSYGVCANGQGSYGFSKPLNAPVTLSRYSIFALTSGTVASAERSSFGAGKSTASPILHVGHHSATSQIKMRVWCRSDAGSNPSDAFTSADVFDGKPHFAGLTYDGSMIRSYVDGNPDTTNAFAGASFSFTHMALGATYRSGNVSVMSQHDVALGLLFDRQLTESEIRSISQNPWQIFQPIPRRIFVPVAAATGDGTGTGSLYAVTLSFPTGTATGTGASNGTGTGALAASSLSSPSATATGSALATGSLPAVSTTAPSATATGSALATGALTTVTLTTITASATGSALATGSLDAIDLSTVAGTATGTTAGNAEGVGSVATIALSAPAASAVGSALATGSFAHISLSAVSGTASAATNGQATADLRPISISAPLAIAIASSVATGGIQSIGLTAPIATASGQAQTIARPGSDTSNSGWTPSTGSDLYAMLDEVTPNDADYISAASAGSVCRLGLGAVADPGTASGQVVSYRASSSTGNGLKVELMQGGTVIATWNHATLPATDTTYQQSLSAAECDAITDYTALSVRLTSL